MAPAPPCSDPRPPTAKPGAGAAGRDDRVDRFRHLHRACASWTPPPPKAADRVQRKCRCARTKLIPAFALGARTQELAHQLVHDVAQRLAPGCLPIFSSDGLALYFYALTAHFGAWIQVANQRRRTWCVDARLLYAQVVKRYTCPNCGAGAGRRHRITNVWRQVLLGRPEAFRQALITDGFSGRVPWPAGERQRARAGRRPLLNGSISPSAGPSPA